MEITAIGIDLAKSVFQLHGVNAAGKCVLTRRLPRGSLLSFIANLKPCLIGMEACSGANYWAREFKKIGHEVRLIAPQFVKPFVKSNKNDRNDAEAICEAILRPSMRFVSPRSIEQQDIQSLHRVRSRRVAARTALGNELRGFLAEYGVILPKGLGSIRTGLYEVLEEACNKDRITPSGRRLFEELHQELKLLDEQIDALEKRIHEIHRGSEAACRLTEIPGVGKITATAMIAAVGDPRSFRNGREFAAWIGLVPKQCSSGGRERLLGISKRGDPYLRTLLIHGARSSIHHLGNSSDGSRKKWIESLIQRRGVNRAAVALANKSARQIWVLLARNEHYKVAA